MRIITVLILIGCVLPLAAQDESLPPKLKQEAEKILKWSADQVLATAVREQNKSAMSMEQILKTDKDWIEGKIPEEFVNGILTNACAARLKELEKEISGALEAFVMDSQGALVCATRKTSDYYQGDEPKWKDAFQSGGLVTGKRQYDESSKATLLHVSAPIVHNAKTIGVVAVGISLTKLAEH